VAKAMALTGPHGPKLKVKTKTTSTSIQDILEIVFITLPPFLIRTFLIKRLPHLGNLPRTPFF
jgi:hypothetical protein